MTEWKHQVNAVVKKAVLEMKGMSCHAWPQGVHQSQSEGREKCSLLSRVWLFVTSWTVTCQAPLCPWNSPGKNTGEGSQPFPSQGIFLDPGIWTQVSCIAGRFFTIWATREAQDKYLWVKCKMTLSRLGKELPFSYRTLIYSMHLGTRWIELRAWNQTALGSW